MRPRRLACLLAVLSLAGGAAVACAGPDAAPSAGITLAPFGAPPDYQLGGAYDPAPGVEIVARDRDAPPVDGVYSICYVNGFQTQPGEREAWPDELLLHDAAGAVIVDPNWPDEALVDTASDLDAIVAVVGPWIEGCAASGFDAVEFDNLDTYARSDGALSFEDNLALAERYVRIAHDAGLAAGQKNAAEDSARLHEEAGFDFAVAEECAAFRECGLYAAMYDDRVIDIEYPDDAPRPFADVCDDPTTPGSVVLRDRALTTPDSPDHVFALCPGE